jgi:hypothetical protein
VQSVRAAGKRLECSFRKLLRDDSGRHFATSKPGRRSDDCSGVSFQEIRKSAVRDMIARPAKHLASSATQGRPLVIWNGPYRSGLSPPLRPFRCLSIWEDTDRHWEDWTSFEPRTDWPRGARRSGPLLCSRHDCFDDAEPVPPPTSHVCQSRFTLCHASSDLQPQRLAHWSHSFHGRMQLILTVATCDVREHHFISLC